MRDVVHARLVTLTLTVLLAACSADSVPPTALRPAADAAAVTVVTPEFKIAVSTKEDFGSSMATNGTNVLVGYQVKDPGVNSVVRAKVMTLEGGQVGYVNTGHTGDAPFAAFDGTNYFIVWSDHSDANENVWGQLISTAGVAVGSPFKVVGENHIKQVYGFAFGSGKYLVMYRTSTNVMKGRFMSPDKTLGTAFTIAESSGDLGFSNLASDGTDFVAAYMSPDNTVLYTRLIHANSTLGSPLTIVDANISDDAVGIAYGGGKYLVTWNRLISETQRNPRGQLVTAGNALYGPKITIDNNVSLETIAGPVGYNDGFLAGYMRWSNQSAYGKTISATGVVGAQQKYFGKLQSTGKMAVPFGLGIGTHVFFAVNRATLAGGGTNFNDLSGFDLKGAYVTP
jgi:hypothetical protein